MYNVIFTYEYSVPAILINKTIYHLILLPFASTAGVQQRAVSAQHNAIGRRHDAVAPTANKLLYLSIPTTTDNNCYCY